MGGNCPEYFDKQKLSLYRNVITFNKQHRKDYQNLFMSVNEANVITLKSRRQANKFLDNL